MTKTETLTKALENLLLATRHLGVCQGTVEAAESALAQPEQEPVAYRATTKLGDTAHFGLHSVAKAWSGVFGTVKAVPLRTLQLVQKPCTSCESLARAVMLDQTSHDDHKREWVGLSAADMREITLVCIDKASAMLMTEDKLKELNK